MSSIEIFFVYSRQDEALRNALEKHLSPLKRHGYISTWYDRRIGAGQEWVREIDNHLDTAQVILLLVSPDFLDSDYCYSIEVKRAVERHERGEARVIPIILRHCYWQEAPFSKLQALPKDAKPVKSWSDQDEAFYDVAEGIRKAVEVWEKKFSATRTATEQSEASSHLVSTVVENAAQMKQTAGVSTTVPDKLTSNSVADSPGILIGNVVEDQSAREMLPERKTEISDLRNRVLIGHSKLVRSVAISPDGRTIVSGSGDQTVKIWNLETGMLQRTLAGHTGEIWSVAISMSGRTIVSGSGDKTARIWGLETGKPSHILNGHGSWIRSVAISADEKTIISSGTDKTVRVWDMETGGLLRTFGDYEEAVNGVAISMDGRTIVSGSHHVVKIWHWETEELPRTLTGHSNWVMSVAISMDGRTIVSGSADETVKIWDLRSGELRHTLRGHEDRINSVAISNDGRIVSGSGDKTVRVWDLQTGELLHILTGHEDRVMSVAISKDGRIVVSGSHDKTVRIWDLGVEDVKDMAQ
jgi:WD40 repeat protein